MSRSSLYRAAGGLILALGLASFAAGDPPDPKDQPVKNEASTAKRLVYILKNGSAKDLAPILAAHFKGVAEVESLPDPTDNCLLINASPAAVKEVIKALEQVDRPPQTASVDIWILEVADKKAGGERTAPAADVDEKDFTGAVADVGARVEALEKKGAFALVKRIRLTAVEGQTASAMVGENKPFVAGVTVRSTGLASRSITYRSTGVKADASVRVSPEKVVTVELKLSDSRGYVPEDGVSVGADEKGKPVFAAEFIETTLTGKLEIPSGTARVAEGVKTDSKSERTHSLVVVGARVIEPNEKPEK